MSLLRSVVFFLVLGALLGGVVTSLIAPGLINWYHTPGGALPPGLDLSPYARQLLADLIRAQTIGAIVGAIVTAALGFALVRGRARKPADPKPPAATS